MSTQRIEQSVLNSRLVNNMYQFIVTNPIVSFLYKNSNLKANAKCCTKKANCNPEPKCYTPELSKSQLIAYFIYFDIIYVLIRLSIASKDDNLLYLFLWIQVQLFFIYVLYYYTCHSLEWMMYWINMMSVCLSELLNIKPNIDPLFSWLGLPETYIRIHKLYCFFFFILSFFVIGFIIFIYIIIIILLGPFLLGYYNMDTTSTGL